MRQVFRRSPERQFYGVFAAFMVLALLGAWKFDASFRNISFPGQVLLVAIAGLLCTLSLDALVGRVVLANGSLTSYTWRNKRHFTVRVDDLTAYEYGDSDWFLVAGEKRYKVPDVDPRLFHEMVVKQAPKAKFKYKVWKGGLTAPDQDYPNLSMLDWKGGIGALIFIVCVAGVFAIFGSRHAAAVALTYCLVRSLYDMAMIVGEISITSEGISESWPRRKQTIPWNEIRVVFRDFRHLDCIYVVVGEHGSITIPAHIVARDDVRRKFMFSVPKRTKAVNFENRSRRIRGRGIRIRRKAPLPIQPIFEPHLT